MSELKSYGVYKVRKTSTNRQVSYAIGLPPEIGGPLAGQKFRVTISGNEIVLVPHIPGEEESSEVEPAPEALELARKFEIPGA